MGQGVMWSTSPEAASTVPLAPPRASLDIRHVVIDDAGPHPSAANGVHHVVRRMAREQRFDAEFRSRIEAARSVGHILP